MIALGLATHYFMSGHLDLIDERLAKLVTDDPSVIDSSLAQYGDMVYPDKKSIVHRLEVIDKCFSHDTVEEIVDALESEAASSNEEWCILALKRLKEASPLALKVSLRSIREGRYQTLDECLVREYRMSMNGISKQFSHEFCEGVRARLVDKDFTPKWDPPALEYVTNDMVDAYFAPLGDSEPELKLPIESREAFV
ncbi:3-hydroxyisobutyryl-CoA hydrolase-like protein 2 mitochondrial [Zea mays]|nr:3-hydroxyisobutyryl-CoA hydrolase-like protein 2 mitochondrial [Zea mays]